MPRPQPRTAPSPVLRRRWLRPPVSLLLVPAALAAPGCAPEAAAPLSLVEELEVVEAAVSAQRAERMAGELVTLSTGFTIGAGAEAVRDTLADWLESQLPCATVTVETAPPADDPTGPLLPTVVMDLGAPGDTGCSWRGRTWSGVLSVGVAAVDPDAQALTLVHRWEAVEDGTAQLDGVATVTWAATAAGPTRAATYRLDHQLHDLPATHTTAEGATTHRPLADEGTAGAAFATGFVADGLRSWEDRAGRSWTLEMDTLAARWVDPLPESGTATVLHPSGKLATLTFSRQDASTIRVVLTGGEADRVFDVGATGLVRAVD